MTINKGVQFLIDRLKEHPEEFAFNWHNGRAYVSNGRWTTVFSVYNAMFSDADWAAWMQAISAVNEDKFLGELMSELADGPERRAKEEAEHREHRKQLHAAKAAQIKAQQIQAAKIYDQRKLNDEYAKAAREANQLSGLQNSLGGLGGMYKDLFK